MAFQPGNDVYSQNTGLSNLDVTFPHIDTRDPTSYDVNFSLGKRWVNRATGNSFTLVSQSSIGGTLQSTWNAGGVNAATTTNLGTVFLSTLAQLEAGTAPTGAYVPLANDVFTFVNSVAISGGTAATTAAQGFVYLATNAQAAAGSLTTNYAINPGSLAFALANSASLPIGSSTAGSGAFTTLTQAGTANINTTGAAITTIGTGGTGATRIGNATGNTQVTGYLTASTTLTATLGNITATNGNLSLATAGNKIVIATGSNASVGTSGAMSGTPGSVTVATTACSSTALIFFSRNVTGGTPGEVSITAQSGTGFTLTSTGNETSTFNWWIINA